MQPTQIIEALLFASDAPLTAGDMASADESLDEAAVEAALHALRMEYERDGRAFQIYEVAGGYQLMTRPEFAPYLERFDTVVHTARLSVAALEVLAIIAYRQPIGRAEIEEIRGVGSAGVLRTLQERELITPVGRGDGLGRPLLYGTTTQFLEHFGFRSLEDLPRPEELPVVLSAQAQRNGGGPGAAVDAAAPSAAAEPVRDTLEAGAADAAAADAPVTDEPEDGAVGG
ncbi:MAG TPA: SMC-Scp complex subunit ScpB [Longimicrobiales bacterium]